MRTPQIILPIILILGTLTSINTQPILPGPTGIAPPPTIIPSPPTGIPPPPPPTGIPPTVIPLTAADLGVKPADDMNCNNVAGLLATATADNTRLTKYQNGDLAAAIRAAQNANDLIQKLKQSLTPIIALQVQRNARSEVGVTSKLTLALSNFEKQLTSEEDDNPFSTSLIAEQARETAQSLSEINERVTSESQQGNGDLNSACNDAVNSIQALNNFLNGLNGLITVTLTDINNRIANYNKGIGECSLMVTTTGDINKNFANSAVNRGTGVRTDIITVTFCQPFDVVPSVGVGLLGFDMDVNSNQIQLDVTGVTAKDFTVTVTAVNGVILRFVHFSYIATITPRSGIYIGTTSMNNNDPDVKIFNAAWGKLKVIPKQLAAPTLSNRKSLAVINSYSQDSGRGKAVRLDVTITGSILYFLVLLNTDTFSAATTNIFWSGDDASLDSRYIPTTFLGPIASGAGSRTDVATSIDVTRYIGKPEVFVGLTLLDMDNRVDGYRVKRMFPGPYYPNFAVQYNTWDGGYNGQLCDGVFLSCFFRDKRNCFKTN